MLIEWFFLHLIVMNDDFVKNETKYGYSLVGSIWMKHDQAESFSPLQGHWSFPAGLPNVLLGALPPKKKTPGLSSKNPRFQQQNRIVPAHTDLSLVMWGQDVEVKWRIQYALLRLWASEIPTILPQKILNSRYHCLLRVILSICGNMWCDEIER